MTLPRPSSRTRIHWPWIVLLTGFSLAGLARANPVPDPPNCSVSPNYNGGCLVAPGPLTGTLYTIVVRGSSNQPMPNVFVEATFHLSIRPCADAQHTCITDSNGTCQIRFMAGGCVNTPSWDAGMIRANGIPIFAWNRVKSPDNASDDTSRPSGTVTVADLVYFAQEFKGQVPAACHDYTNDGAVSTADLPIFGDAFKAGLACTL